MKKVVLFTATATMLVACNSMTVKPNTMKPGELIYAPRGGYTMRRSIKDELERRGYKVIVGKAVSRHEWGDSEAEYFEERDKIPAEARYYVRVRERPEKLRPVWCSLNGIWWWNFSASIADQQTGEELMTWRARGCADSSMRLLRKALDEMEMKNDNTNGQN